MNVKVGGKTMNNWGKFAEMLGLKLEQMDDNIRYKPEELGLENVNG